MSLKIFINLWHTKWTVAIIKINGVLCVLSYGTLFALLRECSTIICRGEGTKFNLSDNYSSTPPTLCDKFCSTPPNLHGVYISPND